MRRIILALIFLASTANGATVIQPIPNPLNAVVVNQANTCAVLQTVVGQAGQFGYCTDTDQIIAFFGGSSPGGTIYSATNKGTGIAPGVSSLQPGPVRQSAAGSGNYNISLDQVNQRFVATNIASGTANYYSYDGLRWASGGALPSAAVWQAIATATDPISASTYEITTKTAASTTAAVTFNNGSTWAATAAFPASANPTAGPPIHYAGYIASATIPAAEGVLVYDTASGNSWLSSSNGSAISWGTAAYTLPTGKGNFGTYGKITSNTVGGEIMAVTTTNNVEVFAIDGSGLTITAGWSDVTPTGITLPTTLTHPVFDGVNWYITGNGTTAATGALTWNGSTGVPYIAWSAIALPEAPMQDPFGKVSTFVGGNGVVAFIGTTTKHVYYSIDHGTTWVNTGAFTDSSAIMMSGSSMLNGIWYVFDIGITPGVYASSDFRNWKQLTVDSFSNGISLADLNGVIAINNYGMASGGTAEVIEVRPSANPATSNRLLNAATSYYTTAASPYTLPAGTKTAVINHALQSTATITLPPNPSDGDSVSFMATGGVTTPTISAGSGETISTVPTTMTANRNYVMWFSSGANAWTLQ